ncbi:MAG: HAMP domain-containing histidine kinase [Bacteroidales bacterium]|jgi:signal transduction histidine kinase|nr:HAMP domain-containing histidine kinase [Bacteroidales bacterium]
MSLRFKSRIALFNVAAAAVTTLLVFVVVYTVVYITAFRHLDSEIRLEKEEVFKDIHWKGDSLILDMSAEKFEAEHRQAEVSPTFLQIVDAKGRLAFRSDNLLNDHLLFADSLREPTFFNIEFNGKLIRQGQFPIFNDKGKLLGQLDIGLPQVESSLVLSNLRLTLCIAFPLMLLIFYLATSWAASRGIAPVNELIHATATVSDKTISKHIPLPLRKDEIYQLAATINELLDRIEISLNREKQITADISHELRTPLTGIRGTLEVLIRKTREPEHYEEKIKQVIREVDTLNRIIDQLLQLSRLDAGNLTLHKTTVGLSALLHLIRERWQQRLDEKNMILQIDLSDDVMVHADAGFLEIMIENLISNSIKYSKTGEQVVCSWNREKNSLSIADNGPGIPQEHIPFLFDRFYRTDASRSSQVEGNGLGLSIVQTLADLQQITIEVTSQPNKGTTFTLQFNS